MNTFFNNRMHPALILMAIDMSLPDDMNGLGFEQIMAKYNFIENAKKGFVISTDEDFKETVQRIDDPANFLAESDLELMGVESIPHLVNDDTAKAEAVKRGYYFMYDDEPYRVSGKFEFNLLQLNLQLGLIYQGEPTTLNDAPAFYDKSCSALVVRPEYRRFLPQIVYFLEEQGLRFTHTVTGDAWNMDTWDGKLDELRTKING